MATPERSAGTASEAPSLRYAARAAREMRFSISSLYRKMLSCAVAKCRLVETRVSGDVWRDPVGSTRHCERIESTRSCVMLANASIQNTTTLLGLLCAAFGGFPAHVVNRVPQLDPRFRGDDTCWLGRSR